MIVCNKCGSEIIEKLPEEDDGAAKRPGKTSAPKEPVPVRRESLISMPFERAAGGFRCKEIDLCTTCRGKLERELNRVKFEFIIGERG
jgi:hypothetical protein